ncbi:hypothetical protein [Niveibacterium sp.]|uniref:TubC N-terminal docking domain-related protein n=1 Tax=Niveibacterium sp. TaxID=2017444 RepID=UPI0035B12B2C
MNLSHLAQLGIVVTLDTDGGLQLDAPQGVLTPDLVTRIRHSKPALLAELKGPCEVGEHGELRSSMPPPVGKARLPASNLHPPLAERPQHDGQQRHTDDCALREVSCHPTETHAELLNGHPGAMAALPFERQANAPTSDLNAVQESAINAWLLSIGEDDAATIKDLIEACRRNEGLRAYCLNRATERAD